MRTRRRYARRRYSPAALDARRESIASKAPPDYTIVRQRGEEVGHIAFKLHSTTMRATMPSKTQRAT
jgi:hypothetical protein